MLALVIDTSSAAVTAAVVSVTDSVEVVAAEVTLDARAHGELLAPSIRKALGTAGARPRELGAIVAGVGPGPFTGLRIGLVTAAAMGDALGIPTYGVCSLDGIGAALDVPALLVATDARRREVYWARYADGLRVAGPDVVEPAGLSTVDSQAMAGAGARLYQQILGLPLLDADYPSPPALASVAAERIRTAAPSERLTPLYLRRPDAVEPAARKPVRQ